MMIGASEDRIPSVAWNAVQVCPRLRVQGCAPTGLSSPSLNLS